MIDLINGSPEGIECDLCVGRRVQVNVAEETSSCPPKLLTVASSIPCS